MNITSYYFESFEAINNHLIKLLKL